MFRKLIFLLLVVFIVGCTGHEHEETENTLEGIQSNSATMQSDLDTIQEELTAVQTKLQEMESPPSMEGDYDFVLSSGIIINPTGTDQSTTIPLHDINTYGDFDSFYADWDHPDESTSIKLAWIRSDQANDWDFYYTDKMLPATDYNSWNRYNIVSPINFDDSDTVVQIEYGSQETIVSSQTFENEKKMNGSLQALENASQLSSLLNNDYQLIFLILDRTRGLDNYQLVVIDSLTDVPDSGDDPPTAEYCQICSGLYCQWRCWQAGYQTQ